MRAKPVPTGAVLAGTEQNNSNTGNKLYVCRVAFAGSVHPGKLVEPWRWCHFGWGGYERAPSTYDVLVANGTWETGTTHGAFMTRTLVDDLKILHDILLCEPLEQMSGLDNEPPTPAAVAGIYRFP